MTVSYKKNENVQPNTNIDAGTKYKNRANKKIPLLSEGNPTLSNLNLLVKPRIFSSFLEKYNLMHFER